MEKKLMNSVKLGSFVLGGLVFLVLLLYMIGKNRNLFGSTYELKARFGNIQGLVIGNNVRFSGIQAGTVKKIQILNDTTIELTMIIDTKMQRFIPRNAIVSIGTEGLVGNKVVNIVPGPQPGSLATDGDILISKRPVDTDDMLQTLSRTNKDLAVIASGLKETILRINQSKGLWSVLNDDELPQNIKLSVSNIRLATAKAGKMVDSLNAIAGDLRNGKGSLGAILKDSAFAHHLKMAILKIESVGEEADSLAGEINGLVLGIQQDVSTGKGTVHALLRDTAMVTKLNASLDNIQKGTDAFNENMEALKHNFLFRGYFKKQEKKKESQQNMENDKLQ